LTVDVDSAVGVVTEKNAGLAARTSGALTSGQRLAFKLSDTATVTQNATALWKLDDFGDGLYTFGIGVAASVTSRIQIKLEFQDVYKAQPPAPGVQRNDLAFLTTLLYKFWAAAVCGYRLRSTVYRLPSTVHSPRSAGPSTANRQRGNAC